MASLATQLFSDPATNVFAILDGASIPDLLDMLYQHYPEFVCLYRGELDPDIAEVAPYLVRLEQKTPVTDWLLTRGWGKHWGIFVTTKSDLTAVRQHFRRFLTVHSSDGTPMLFRYYDPRVLRVYLPTCNAQELATVFGPVERFVSEGSTPEACLQFHLLNGALIQENLNLLQEV
jgi:hypothetical protein